MVTNRGALTSSCDVFFVYTQPEIAKSNVLTALKHGADAVIGISGIIEADFAEIAVSADKYRRGVLAVGNFAISAVLLQEFAEMAAKLLPH